MQARRFFVAGAALCDAAFRDVVTGAALCDVAKVLHWQGRANVTLFQIYRGGSFAKVILFEHVKKALEEKLLRNR